jgi:hypothetical protein
MSKVTLCVYAPFESDCDIEGPHNCLKPVLTARSPPDPKHLSESANSRPRRGDILFSVEVGSEWQATQIQLESESPAPDSPGSQALIENARARDDEGRDTSPCLHMERRARISMLAGSHYFWTAQGSPLGIAAAGPLQQVGHE